MCGRYSVVKQQQELAHFYHGDPNALEDYRPNYNAAPMQTMPVVTSDGIELMTWGLVPSWSKIFKPSFTSINARGETVAEKPLYRTPFKKRRALIPATGFYEWQQRETFKQPFHIRPKERDLFSFAGLYDIWYDSANLPHKSFTIITTTPNEQMGPIHDRMPVILQRDEEEHWLDPDAKPEALQLLLDPFEHELELYEVDRAVGNVRNNTPELVNPLAQQAS
jgi:putative SOS response-associated peptidase YedK